uniref:Uncharacterized protein n=1 Tax=Brassica campestris TaxID=3711 RepID=M4FF44_BRACM
MIVTNLRVRVCSCRSRFDSSPPNGNKLFKEQEYHDAVRHHTEAIQRNPKEPTTRPRGMQDQGIKNILTDLNPS